ncbi:MAG: hypothetical protein ACK4QL_09935 [Pseudanabaenaceae cyanobacterium]
MGILVAPAGLIGLLLYSYRAWIYHQLADDRHLLVHWRYRDQEWQEFSKKEAELRAEEAVGMTQSAGWFIGILSVVFGLITGYFFQVVLIGGALFLLVTLVWWLHVQHFTNWQKATRVECRLSGQGVLLNRDLHVWRGWGARLERAEVGKYSEHLHALAITYSRPAKHGRSYTIVRLPIPIGDEEKARAVAENLIARK